MKPLGPIPAGYAAIDGELAIGGARVSHWAEQAGRTPLFVYSKELIAQRFADLRAAMPERLKINYAIKANSFSPLLDYVSTLADGLDIASGGELEHLGGGHGFGPNPWLVKQGGQAHLHEAIEIIVAGRAIRTKTHFDACIE